MVIVDTNFFIAALRGNEIAQSRLRGHKLELALSAVTAMELYVGATTTAKKKAIDSIVEQHELLPLDKNISETAMRLVREYNTGEKQILVPDALIAAACLEYKASLLTLNTKDFKFIKGLKLVK